MSELRFDIMKKTWVMRVLTNKKYKKTHGTDSVAITDYRKRRIDISPHGVDSETLIHELIHAYLAECCVGSADLENDNLEEILAELMSKRGREILDLSDFLLRALS